MMWSSDDYHYTINSAISVQYRSVSDGRRDLL